MVTLIISCSIQRLAQGGFIACDLLISRLAPTLRK